MRILLVASALLALAFTGCLASGDEASIDAPPFPDATGETEGSAAHAASDPVRGYAYDLLSSRRLRGPLTDEGEVPMEVGDQDRLRLVVRNHVDQDLDGFRARFHIPEALRVVDGDLEHEGILTPEGWRFEIVVEAVSVGRHVVEASVERGAGADVPAWVDYAVGCQVEGACPARSDAGATTPTSA